MKRMILAAAITFMFSVAYGQGLTADFRNGAQSFISANIGVSIPGGRFGSKTIYENYNNPYSESALKLPLTGSEIYKVIGFAGPGLSAGVNGAWYFNQFWGIGMRASFTQCSLAKAKLSSAYTAAYGENSSFEFNSNDNYISVWIMPGVYFGVALSDDVQVGLDVGFGPQYLHSPEFSCNYSIDGSSNSEIVASNADWDFSYYVSMGVKYKMDTHLAVSFDVNYNEIYMKFDYSVRRGVNTFTETHDVFYKCPTLNLGLVYLFK